VGDILLPRPRTTLRTMLRSSTRLLIFGVYLINAPFDKYLQQLRFTLSSEPCGNL